MLMFPTASAPSNPQDAAWAARVRQLESGFREIAETRLAIVPVLHPGLRVEAIGFEPEADQAEIALGVLVTPWFMNLMRLPLRPDEPRMLGMGHSAPVEIAGRRFDFIGADEPLVGRYELCSLFSPMFEFEDHDAAVATAREVLSLLRQPAPAADAAASSEAGLSTSRRGFLFGRGPAGGR
jgi:[NiFe] hydrogenase assembly HybE family chaperone